MDFSRIRTLKLQVHAAFIREACLNDRALSSPLGLGLLGGKRCRPLAEPHTVVSLPLLHALALLLPKKPARPELTAESSFAVSEGLLSSPTETGSSSKRNTIGLFRI
jgi:hypothetical protein